MTWINNVRPLDGAGGASANCAGAENRTLKATGLPGDLEWWRENRDAARLDRAVLRDLLGRLQAWKAQHDADRARQAGPFLQMAWDGVFGDENGAVVEAIGEVERALSSSRTTLAHPSPGEGA